MRLFGVRPNVPQQQNFTYNDTNRLSRAGSWLVCALATIAAAGLVFCAGSQSVQYGWTVGAAKSETAAWIMATGALSAALMMPVCWTVALMGRGILVRLAAAILGLLCLAFGVGASLGFIAGNKDAGAADRLASSDSYRDARAVKDAARVELATLAAVKIPTRAQITRRRELAAILANNDVKTSSKPVTVDPQATAISGYMAALGYDVKPEKVSLWTTAFAVTFFEVASALALSVAAASWPPSRKPRQRHRQRPEFLTAPWCLPTPKRPPRASPGRRRWARTQLAAIRTTTDRLRHPEKAVRDVRGTFCRLRLSRRLGRPAGSSRDPRTA
jgi:hypothetical protein